jgi:hypothetical protein
MDRATEALVNDKAASAAKLRRNRATGEGEVLFLSLLELGLGLG